MGKDVEEFLLEVEVLNKKRKDCEKIWKKTGRKEIVSYEVEDGEPIVINGYKSINNHYHLDGSVGRVGTEIVVVEAEGRELERTFAVVGKATNGLDKLEEGANRRALLQAIEKTYQEEILVLKERERLKGILDEKSPEEERSMSVIETTLEFPESERKAEFYSQLEETELCEKVDKRFEFYLFDKDGLCIRGFNISD